MKILMINPWIGSLAEYTHGLCKGFAKSKIDIDLITNYHESRTTSDEYSVYPLFFKYSETMKRGKLRKIIRTIEYIYVYFQIYTMICKNKYDIVHIQWCLLYKFDSVAIGLIRKKVKKIVYTAHNALPHVNGEKYITDLEKMYNKFDVIIVHGKSIREEFEYYFPKYSDKICIQYHGCRLNENNNVSKEKIPKEILNKLKDREKIYIFFGGIFYNKGVDILMKIWRKDFEDSKNLLVVAGRITERYGELDYELNNRNENVLLIEGYLDDEVLNYLVDTSNIVILPYRHASMSGVVFTAAQHRKTIIATNTGSITEYLENRRDSFVIENNEEELRETLLMIENDMSVEELIEMGKLLHNNINSKYNWEIIAKNLIKEVLV